MVFRSQNSLNEILEFYTERNGNKIYSTKLFEQIKQTISLISNHILIGKATDEDFVRVVFKNHYAIFYEIKEKVIEIQLIRDTRRNPEDLHS